MRHLSIMATLVCAASPVLAGDNCWDIVEAKYGVPKALLYAIAKTESNMNPRAEGKNTNGSRDIGLMQINTSWLPVLKRHGIAEKDLKDPCVSLHVGAWVLANNFATYGKGWRAVGAYNARTEYKRVAYAKKVEANLAKLTKESVYAKAK